MEKMIVLEIPEEEVPKLEVSLAQAIARLEELEAEHVARQQRIALLSAESDQILESIKRSLRNVEKYLAASDAGLYLQR
jgi:septal ring factor EnvC (AmiA/AmiB activator)